MATVTSDAPLFKLNDPTNCFPAPGDEVPGKTDPAQVTDRSRARIPEAKGLGYSMRPGPEPRSTPQSRREGAGQLLKAAWVLLPGDGRRTEGHWSDKTANFQPGNFLYGSEKPKEV